MKKCEENNQNGSVPDSVAKEFNGGHDFKTSLMAGFERGFRKIPKLSLRFLLCAFLQTGI